MPNIASILKEEILRLARKEVRTEVAGLKKASAQYRSDIAELKRRLTASEKQLAQSEKKAAKKQAAPEGDESATKVRFSAKGFASQRKRLGLSAGELGALLGVSAQTVYNWEAEKSRPRQQHMAAIAEMRSLGKRGVKARLASLLPEQVEEGQ